MSFVYYVLALLLGAAVGTQVNRGIYRFAWNSRLISPWSPRHPDASDRSWRDRIPILGWWWLRRDADVHGRRFWLRPMLIELGLGIGFAWLFHHVIENRGLVPVNAAARTVLWHCWIWYGWYLFLISLLVIATFIDFDERTIPDEVTVPGTLVGLLLMALVPTARLPEAGIVMALWEITPVHIGSPAALPAWVPSSNSLYVVVGCFLVWCFALLPIMWTTRKGVGRTLQFACASLLRPSRKTQSKLDVTPRKPHPWTWVVFTIAALGCAGISFAWLSRAAHPTHWESLVSSVIGMAFGGGIVWWIRIIGFLALRREAMGFGDVTLMAMIGAFVGWQAALIIFMLAPFAALVVVVLQLVFTRDNELAFGPYLCFSALMIMIFWSPVWNDWAAKGVFSMNAVLMPVLIAGFLLAAPLLWLMSLIKTKVLGYTD